MRPATMFISLRALGGVLLLAVAAFIFAIAFFPIFAHAAEAPHATTEAKPRAASQEELAVLKKRHELAPQLFAQGKYAEAEAELRAIIKASERELGPEHPDMLFYQDYLATVLQFQGKYAQAETVFRPVLAARMRVLGPEDLQTLDSRYGLACVLNSQDKYAEAEKEFRAVMASYQRIFEPEHVKAVAFRIVECSEWLASCLKKQKKFTEALPYARQAWDGCHKTLGENHPITKMAKKLLGELEQSQKAK